MSAALSPSVPRLEAAFDVSVLLGPLADHGETSVGHRRVVPILGGRVVGVAGLSLDARILPGGADWQRVRPDGTIEIDGRYSAETDDGDLLYLQARGLRTGPPEVLAALGRGEQIDPADYVFRTTVAVETSAPRLGHLQRSLFVASCVRDPDSVRYAAYRVV